MVFKPVGIDDNGELAPRAKDALVKKFIQNDLIRGGIPKWAPNTAYAISAPVVAPDGSVVNAIAAFTSGTTYDASKWSSNKGYVSMAGTNPASIPVLRNTGDGLAARWEFIHNGGGGYIWHLLQGQNSTSGDWIWGVGLDSGAGNGLLLRVKNAGIGQKIEMVASATAAAVGLTIQHDNLNGAIAIKGEQSNGAGLLAKWISYDQGTLNMMEWYGRQGKAGTIQGNSGELTWWKQLHARGNLHVRSSNEVVADVDTNHVYLDDANLTFRKGSGTSNIFYPSRIRAAGTTTVFQMGNNSALTADDTASSFETVIAMGTGGTGAKRLGFFGVTPVVKPAALPADATDLATAQTLVNYIKNSVLKPLGLAA